VLLDVLMPQMDGWEALRELKANPETRSIPVIVLSVVENRAYGFALGAFDYLVKPIERSMLFDVLSRAGVLASRGYVLVVDDQADVRSLLERELVAAGYRVRAASGGAEALAQIESETPSVVLLDLMMPPPDGFEVLYRLREDARWRNLPVVVVTARELSSEDLERLNGWAQRVVRKGGDPNRLVSEVLQTLEESRALEPA
jgi:CheY-like chemotaxis protein